MELLEQVLTEELAKEREDNRLLAEQNKVLIEQNQACEERCRRLEQRIEALEQELARRTVPPTGKGACAIL